jgi:putative membrane protein
MVDSSLFERSTITIPGKAGRLDARDLGTAAERIEERRDHPRGRRRLEAGVRFVLLLFWLIVIVSCVLVLVRTSTSPRRARELPAAENPREILKRRYAAGEIDEDEYLRRMSGISQDW